MNISTNIKKQEIELVNPKDVPVGRVYSWGAKAVSYLRVADGSVCLSGPFEHLSLSAHHFHPASKVQIGKADLTITYEG